ncbi:MAG: hypothetical protein N4A44_00235 [Alphaproteobacteria bacterium]|jgi:hypothetical protein|nr:hypothetical protein [Alphaproteobacteria bacterium]
MSSNNDIYEVERILFWFYESQKLRLKGFSKRDFKSQREYSVDDVAICIKRLYLSGLLTKDELDTFSLVCHRGIIPDERDEDDVLIYTHWNSFLEVVSQEFSKKGWLEKSACKTA